MVAGMTDFQKVQAYLSAMAQAQIMLKNGIIGKDDIVSIEHKLAVSKTII